MHRRHVHLPCWTRPPIMQVVNPFNAMTHLEYLLTSIKFTWLAPLPGACLEWPHGKNSDGYGTVVRNGKTQYTHRIAWSIHHARPILPKMEIDHLCRNHPCYNPFHLEEVTKSVNVFRGAKTSANRAKTRCPKGHPYDEENTYFNVRGHRECIICRTRRS